MIAALFITALAAVTSPSPLAPSGKWIVEYRDDMCLASRAFGPAGATVTFALKPGISIGDGSQTLFVLTAKTGAGVRRGTATITASPSGLQRQVNYVSWIPKGDKLRGYEVEANAEFITSLGDAAGLTITAGKDSFSFATGKMLPVLNALTTCNEDLLRGWGVDPAASAKTLNGVSPATWFPQDAYPAEAKRRGAQGRSVVLITVAAEGRPSACRVVVKADPDLDAATCRLATRNSRFEKAPGKTDRYAVFSVRWELDY